MSRRRAAVLMVGIAAVLAVLLGRYLNAGKIGGQTPADPFRIAGNLYYVGASDVAVFLITGPAGHIVIDAGYPSTARMVMTSIAKLGFDIKDVKMLLSSEPHPDHAGGLGVLQQASGAALWASDANATSIAAGGDDADAILPIRALLWTGLVGYPPARIDHRLIDGETIRVGPTVLTAHVLGGHSRGCTSFSFTVRDADRVLTVVSVCDLVMMETMGYPEQVQDFTRTFQVLRSLPADIWVTAHARRWGRYRKYVASQTATNPVESFIDREGYRAYIDAAERDIRRGVMH